MIKSPYTSERVLSSTVIKEEILGSIPDQDKVRYIEVPVVEEIIRRVPRRETVEIEKRVPKYETQWVEKFLEVPQIQYVEKRVEVPQVKEVIRHVPVKQVVEVPKEVIKYVPKIEPRILEQEVPGEVVIIPKPYTVENKIVVPKYIDREQLCVVAQSLHPIITESDSEIVEVEMREFNPYLVPVDVVVPRPVARKLIAGAKTEEHRIVDVPVAHFNALLQKANPHLNLQELENSFITLNGVVPIANDVKYVPISEVPVVSPRKNRPVVTPSKLDKNIPSTYENQESPDHSTDSAVPTTPEYDSRFLDATPRKIVDYRYHSKASPKPQLYGTISDSTPMYHAVNPPSSRKISFKDNDDYPENTPHTES